MSSAAELPAFKWLFADYEFDEARWVLSRHGTSVELERRPLELLLCLLRRAGEVVTKEELLIEMHGHVHVVDRALTNAVVKLRKALEDQEQKLIQTVQRVGYRLAVPVRRLQAAPTPPALLALQVGEAVPFRPSWRLTEPLGTQPHSNVWLALQEGSNAKRVFKFCPDGRRLAALKREVTLLSVLRQGLGERDDFIEILGSNFEQSPYFIECEHRGQNLQQWAEQGGQLKAMPLPGRIGLALRVVEAVAAAHSVGVLHKDLKPSNILVDRDADGALRVCVSDFGSGKLMEPDRLQQLDRSVMGFTQTRSVLDDDPSATLLYLAPEVLAGHVPTVQTDVYALGILVYQLMVGDCRRPLAPGWEEQIHDPLLRSDIALAAHGEAARRLGSAQELADRLRRLPERRAAAELERQFSEQHARLRRALERNRMRRPFMRGAMAVFALGSAVCLFFFVQSSRQRDEARAQFARAEAINKFLSEDLLLLASPSQGGDPAITLKEAMYRAAAGIDGELARTPLTAADVHLALGTDFSSLSEFEAAATQFAAAANLYSQHLGRSGDKTLQARFMQVKAVAYSGKPDEAQKLFDLAMADLGRNAQPAARTLMYRYEAKANIDRELYHTEQAVEDLRLAREQALKLPEVDRTHISLYDRAIGRILAHMGKPEGLSLLADTAHALESSLGAASYETLYTQELLGEAYMEADRLELAQPLFRHIYQLAMQKYGADSALTLMAQENYAEGLLLNGNLAEAEPLYRAAYQSHRKHQSRVSNDALVDLSELATLLNRQGRYAESLALLAEGLREGLDSEDKSQHPLIVWGLSNQADALIGLGRAAEAAPWLDKIQLDELRNAAPERKDWDGVIAYQRGMVALAQGDSHRAVELLQQALPILKANEEPGSRILALTSEKLASARQLARAQ